jgi:hypothetical protein
MLWIFVVTRHKTDFHHGKLCIFGCKKRKKSEKKASLQSPQVQRAASNKCIKLQQHALVLKKEKNFEARSGSIVKNRFPTNFQIRQVKKKKSETKTKFQSHFQHESCNNSTLAMRTDRKVSKAWLEFCMKANLPMWKVFCFGI